MRSQTWRDRNLYLSLLGLALVVLLQATILTRIRFLGAQPELLLVLVICWSLLYGVSEGLVLAFVGGLAIDVISGLPLGVSPLALMPVCLITTAGRSRVYAHNLWLPVFFVMLATPLHGWIVTFIRQLQGVPANWPVMTREVILPALLLNAILTLIIARILPWTSGAARLDTGW